VLFEKKKQVDIYIGNMYSLKKMFYEKNNASVYCKGHFLHLLNDSNANKIKSKIFKRWIYWLKMTAIPVFIRNI